MLVTTARSRKVRSNVVIHYPDLDGLARRGKARPLDGSTLRLRTFSALPEEAQLGQTVL